MNLRLPSSLLAAAILSCCTFPSAAQQNNDVQWAGASHTGWNDRRPRVPRNGESFRVRFQSFRDDLTNAAVRVDTGSVTTVPALKTGSRGPYDLWEAVIPATSSSILRYAIELTDGSDTDYLGNAGVTDNLDPARQFVIDFNTLDHAPVGATPVSGGTVFKVWSPSSTSCTVRGTFNNWGQSAQLAKVGEHFIGFVPNANPGAQYKYFFNNSVWNSDPRSAALVPTSSYNSIIFNHDAYAWQNPAFSPRPAEELVVYQLHVGTFAGRNDPAGSTPNPSRYIDVANRVQHLVDLGVNAVMLNPLNEFPGDFSGGYNNISPFSIESRLGTPDQFKQMVDALHSRGIAVLLDIVFNHSASSDNIIWNFGGSQQYFDSPAVGTPWGSQADFDKPGVQRYYTEAAENLLTDFRLDGFRMDAVMYMTDSLLTPQWATGQQIVRAINDNKVNRHLDKLTIAEIYIDNRWVTDQTPAGLGFTAQYQNEFKEAVRAAVFDAAVGSSNMQRVANVLDGQGFGVSGSSAFNYFELHDDAWPLNGNQRAVRRIDTTPPHDDHFARGRTMIGNALALLSRGIPAILQGTEWLEDDGWEANKIDWSHKATYAGVFRFYQDLIRLRTSDPALFANSPLWAYHVNEALDVLAFERHRPDAGSFVAIVNLSNADRANYRIGIPREGRWTAVINSNDPIYGGPGGGPAVGDITVEPIANGPFPRSVALTLPARSIILLQHEAPRPCAADVNGDNTVDLADFFEFLQCYDLSQPCADIDAEPGVDLADFFTFFQAYDLGC